jgi:ribose-phosphate pyrophosphokinase
MIKVTTSYGDTILKPTIFPDGTSQIWHIENWQQLFCRDFRITWYFESEREILDLYSFKALLAQPKELRHVSLHMPFLPYARQDKTVGNDLTFNLTVFAELINNLEFDEVTAVDVHNPTKTQFLIRNFKNVDVVGVHEKVIVDFAPLFVVFPDKGAFDRYGKKLSYVNTIICDKTRDQFTGNITGLTLNYGQGYRLDPNHGDAYLIVDDICDGGATFIKVAETIRKECPKAHIGLFVTHGIFSKGRQHLLDNGIDKIYTTDSLLRNTDGYKV